MKRGEREFSPFCLFGFFGVSRLYRRVPSVVCGAEGPAVGSRESLAGSALAAALVVGVARGERY